MMNMSRKLEYNKKGTLNLPMLKCCQKFLGSPNSLDELGLVVFIILLLCAPSNLYHELGGFLLI